MACELYETCRENREAELTFRASVSEQMRNAIATLSTVAESIKDNNEKHWEAIGKLQEGLSQEKAGRISADGHIESKMSFERGKFAGYAVLISAIITGAGIVMTKMMK